MKTKILLLIAITFISSSIFAQVAVNTSGAEAHASSILDINSTDKGLLIPRVDISDVNSNLTPVVNPAEGLIVYNLSGGSLPAGFYYWSGADWKLVTNSTSVLTNSQTSNLYETAELYANNDFNAAQTINLTTSTAYYGWISAIEGETFGDTHTDVNNTTADQIIVGEDGLYEVEISASFGGSNNSQIRGTVFMTPNGGGSAVETRIRFLRKLSSSGDLGSASTHGLIRLSAGDALDIRYNSTTDGEYLNLFTMNFIVNKVGD